MNDVIILTRMYVGKYLQNNIGHEVINLFKDDNGDNYIWINEAGLINPRYDDSVKAVLLVKYVEKGVMEVIAKAEELEQIVYKTGDITQDAKAQVSFLERNGVKYGGVLLHKVFGKTDAEKIVTTFKTKKLRKTKIPVYLIEDNSKTASYDTHYYLPEKHFSSQSLKMYYTDDRFPGDYKVLNDVINDDSLWEDRNTTERLDLNDSAGSEKGRSFLSILGKENDELVFSNFLAYIFEANRQVFADFAKEVLGINSFSSQFDLIRESKDNIDLWIEDDDTIIVIENKIKSKINGERHDIYSDAVQSQLSKYYRYAVDYSNGKDVYCYLFTPDYNFIDLSKYESGKHYKTINYSEIHDFYSKNAGKMLHTNHFVEFLDSIDIHSKTIDNSNFETMKARFIESIKRVLDRESD